MAFTPREIEDKDFLITLRGYDKEEVRAFLRALAADYAEALKGGGAKAGKGSYHAWGREMADLLQQAQEAATEITRKANEEAGGARARAEDEAARLREAARNAAARLSEEAERQAQEVRAEADRYARETRTSAETEAGQRMAEVTLRVEELQSTEKTIRERLGSLEKVLGSVRATLGPEKDAEVIDLAETEPEAERSASEDSSDASQRNTDGA